MTRDVLIESFTRCSPDQSGPEETKHITQGFMIWDVDGLLARVHRHYKGELCARVRACHRACRACRACREWPLERPVPDVSLERDHVSEHVANTTRAAAGGAA